MNYFAYHSTALSGTQNALGDDCPTFTWKGTSGTSYTIKIIPDTLERGKSFALPGGFQTQADVSFCVNVADLPQNEQPTLKQSVVYLNRVYRIDKVIDFPGGLMQQYMLKGPNPV